jgi:outer membrane protein assembly factor BamA
MKDCASRSDRRRQGLSPRRVQVEGNSIFSEAQIRAVIGLNKGDIADGEKVSKGLFENLKKFYGQQGFIEYTAEPVPTFKDNPANPNEGIVDFTVTIEEGKQFTLRVWNSSATRSRATTCCVVKCSSTKATSTTMLTGSIQSSN